MTIYNARITREIRLTFEGIKADSPEAALRIARDGTIDDADDVEDLGEDLSARVETGGDGAALAFTVHFAPECQRQAAAKRLAALQAFIKADALAEECGEWKWENLEHAFRSAREAVAEAEACGVPSAEPAAVPPIVTVAVRGGLIEDMDATIPVQVVVEDWDIQDDDTGKKPTRSIWKLAGGLSGQKAEKLRRLIAND